MALYRDGKAVAQDRNVVAASDAGRLMASGASFARDLLPLAESHAMPAGEVTSSRVRLSPDLVLIESAKTGNTEKTVEPAECHEMLRSDPRSIASRFAGNDENPIPGGSTLTRSQTRLKTRAEKAGMPKSWIGLSPDRARGHLAAFVAGALGSDVTMACANCGIAPISEKLVEWASEQGRWLPAPIASLRHRGPAALLRSTVPSTSRGQGPSSR